MTLSKILPQFIAGASFLAALTACEGPDAPASSARSPESASENGKIIFSETFSDSGLFQIRNDPSGRISYAVQARIGSQAEKRMAASATQPTLSEVYLALQGGAVEVPDVVKNASAELAQQQVAHPDLPTQAETPEAVALGKSASESDFKTNYCRDIQEYSYLWHWQSCDWAPSVHTIETPFVDSKNGLTDRVYAYNSTPYTATLELWNLYKTSHPNVWRPTLQPYWVTWFQWGGTYSFALADMTLPAGAYGEMGLSTHTPIPIVR